MNKIVSLVEPLDTKFGIDLVGVIQIKDDGTFASYGTIPETSEYVFSNGDFVGHPFMRSPKCVPSGYFFLDLMDDAEHIQKQKPVLDKFKIRQFFVIIKSENNLLTIRTFGSTKNQTRSPNVYFNNLSEIHKFIAHFDREAAFIHRTALDCGVNVLSVPNPKFEQVSSMFKDSFQEDSMRLTVQERKVLRLLIRGLSASKMSGLLNLSPRTIEHYIENIKTKNDCSTKAELIDMAFDSGQIFHLL